ncbi:SRPBCC domain-containing protein [Flavisphingomonas formosensis]|uniref:SRPBCC domain-containing protein n=1 Tax=Flavisphingomonas formosensis TaxID=861534 RepID=UPI0022B76BE0|nr:SRPBCC domain-containing protein [Sphingomonas formosensis]
MVNGGRIDSVSRVILASPRTLFRTFLEVETFAAWRVPEGMTASFSAFEPRAGGGYRMVLRYGGPQPHRHGKSRPGEDEVHARFVALYAEEKVVEEVRFVSDDPAFAGVMRLTTLFEPAREGTKVALRAEGVPAGISQSDHQDGMTASLRQLARLTE